MAMGVKDLVAEARRTVEAVPPEEARAREGALILDVREPGELEAKGRVPGALHVPRGLLEASADPDSPMAATTLKRMGYDGAAVIEGGIEAWRKAGLPVEGG